MVPWNHELDSQSEYLGPCRPAAFVRVGELSSEQVVKVSGVVGRKAETRGSIFMVKCVCERSIILIMGGAQVCAIKP